MNISGIRTGILSIPLRKPFKTALRTADVLCTVIVVVETDAGPTGWGEAPPTDASADDSLDGIRLAVREFIAPCLRGRNVDSLDNALDAVADACPGSRRARAAVDMALHDLFAQVAGQPLFRFLGGCRNRIETDLTISINSPEEMARDSSAAVARGFRILKLKVGTDPAQDIERIRAVRAAVNPAIVLRIDANQGWRVGDAVRVMQAVEKAGLGVELVEQPVLASDLQGMRQVRAAITTPVLADESVFSDADAEQVLTAQAADWINIKLMKTGGLRGALRLCATAETHGAECFMGCMLESRLAVTAAAHLACARGIITRYDLDSPLFCTEDPVRGGAVFAGPRLVLPETPGLGIVGIDGVVWN